VGAFEIIYSSSYRPNHTRALDVLAFLLVPAAAFVDGDSEIWDVERYRDTA
jgi:hypothetical protein